MKLTLLIIALFTISLNTFSQETSQIIDILNSSDNVSVLNDKLKAYPTYNASLSFINSESDSSDFAKIALSKKLGETFQSVNKNEFYKISELDSTVSMRVSYIYFNGLEKDKKDIDKLRKKLIAKINNGTSFDELAQTHSMDGSSRNGGDMNWINASFLNQTFVDEVLKHNKGDLFEIDITDQQWYYLVLKTYNESVAKSVAVITIKKQ